MKKLLLSFVIALSLAFGGGMVLAPAAYAASPTDDAKNAACQGIAGTVGSSCNGGGSELENVVKVLLNLLSVLAGVLAVIMIIISGLKYITSNGDSSSIASAKTTMIYAIVGLVIVASAQAIVFFVLSETT